MHDVKHKNEEMQENLRVLNESTEEAASFSVSKIDGSGISHCISFVFCHFSPLIHNLLEKVSTRAY